MFSVNAGPIMNASPLQVFLNDFSTGAVDWTLRLADSRPSGRFVCSEHNLSHYWRDLTLMVRIGGLFGSSTAPGTRHNTNSQKSQVPNLTGNISPGNRRRTLRLEGTRYATSWQSATFWTHLTV
ncbi:hypothetical protein THAOC_03977 [Thalassiosira oceanica]|uniref:Uncharacterized protein n=1 Tax=Thalassiosira oceanica TaxID=159749 RepID=K0T6C9_THAOC|nr:hypothetical protein THAOC_03977 [Thalassiosira oceanica]|eukprot:EJK74348.1 hypothetical protein THAOC_03977 [Thalassiosira oceanica]